MKTEASVGEVKVDAGVSNRSSTLELLCVRFRENSAPEVRKTFIFTATHFKKCWLMSGLRSLYGNFLGKDPKCFKV